MTLYQLVGRYHGIFDVLGPLSSTPTREAVDTARKVRKTMRAELLYITDTYCIWCYGFGGVIGRIASDYADRIDIRLLHGGMIPSDLPLPDLFRAYPDRVALHARVALMSGEPFEKAYLGHIENIETSNLTLNSTVPARAALALKFLGVENELAVAKAIQRAYYVNGNDLQDLSTYDAIATEFGVDFTAFQSKFDAPQVKNAIMEAYRFVESLGIRGFPAVLLRGNDGRYIVVAQGFLPIEDLRSNLEQALLLHGPASQSFGQACTMDGVCS